jgi:hypothetical protein
MARLSNTLRTQ